MEINEYQDKALATAKYPAIGGVKWLYPVMGLGEEAGEVLGKLAKAIRDANGEVTDAVRLAVARELGDVMWMVAAVAKEFDYKLVDVAQMNLDKLADRQKRGVIGGSGDNR